jgi:lipopolysaccharide/colanic/teichoic acid biosynthesis glycosyltransferase
VYNRFLKRPLDLFVALVVFMVASPVFIVLTVSFSMVNRGSAFFRQVRPGKKEKLFTVLKFKTMTDQKDTHGNLLPDEKRLTALGKFVRKTSLDEIPQLLNVIRGDMSLIGPRPWLTEYLTLYSAEQRRRFEVRPGITGWAQVNGRNTLGWKERIEHDVWYVDHLTFAVDAKIVFKTILNVVKAQGISSATSATMEKFTGNEN